MDERADGRDPERTGLPRNIFLFLDSRDRCATKVPYYLLAELTFNTVNLKRYSFLFFVVF